MGHDPYLVIVDELGCHARDDLYVAALRADQESARRG